jgi:hypothetical protein
MAYDVFVSYSAKDKATADAVCTRLEAEGIRCWIAPRDILPGLDWGEAIVNAIEGCRIMVLIFSANANASTQIKREVERAVHKGKIIIPFRIENVAPAKSLEYFISTSHWLDAITTPLEKHIARLHATILSLLNDPASCDPSSLPNSAISGVSVLQEGEKGFIPRYASALPRIALVIMALGLVVGLCVYLYPIWNPMIEKREASSDRLYDPRAPEIPERKILQEQPDIGDASWSKMLDEARRLRYQGKTAEALAAYSRYEEQFGKVYPSTKQYITTVQAFTLQQETLGVLGGVYIFEIMPGSLAEEIGLAVGDVIFGCGGIAVHSNNSYFAAQSRISPGAQIQIDYLRMDKTGHFLKKHAKLTHGVLGVRIMDF